MTFQEILQTAVLRVGTESKLARKYGWNHGAPRSWRIGAGLPTKPDQVAGLATESGLSFDQVKLAIQEERRRRMAARFDALLVPVEESKSVFARKGLSRVDPSHPLVRSFVAV